MMEQYWPPEHYDLPDWCVDEPCRWCNCWPCDCDGHPDDEEEELDAS